MQVRKTRIIGDDDDKKIEIKNQAAYDKIVDATEQQHRIEEDIPHQQWFPDSGHGSSRFGSMKHAKRFLCGVGILGTLFCIFQYVSVNVLLITISAIILSILAYLVGLVVEGLFRK